jgi:cytochrome c556
MIRRPSIRRSVTMLALVAATTAACSLGSGRMIGTGDVVFDRQRLMRVQGAQLSEIQSKFRAGNIEGIGVNAEVVAITAMQIPSLFPDGSLSEKSRAKPEIWQRWGEFEATAKNLTIWSERLRDAARAKDEKAVADIVKDYARVSCGACHEAFRKPPVRS